MRIVYELDLDVGKYGSHPSCVLLYMLSCVGALYLIIKLILSLLLSRQS